MISRVKRKINAFQGDADVREVARGALIAFILKLIGAALSFAFNVAVARLLGAEGAGLYFLAFSVTAISAVIGGLGLDSALLRFTATHATRKEWGKVKGVYALSMRMGIAASILLTIAVFFSAPLAGTLFGKPDLVEPLRWMSLSILPFVIMMIQAEALKGLKHIGDAMTVQGVGLPLVSVLLVFPLAQTSGLIGVTWAYVCGAVFTSLLGMWLWRRSVLGYEDETEQYSFNDLWMTCKPLLIVSLMNRGLMPWAPIMLLAIWTSSEEVGVFGAATRVSLLISFLLLAINNVVAPKFAELYTKGDMEALANIARRSAMLITLLVSPIFVILFFYGSWVMSLFGESFVGGGMLLSVLALGQLINVASGSVGSLLIISGHEKLFRNITVSFGLIQFLLIIIFAPMYGGLGAAIATSITMASINITAAYFVYARLGILIIPGTKKGEGIGK